MESDSGSPGHSTVRCHTSDSKAADCCGCRCPCKYKLCAIKSKEVIFLLVWYVAFRVFQAFLAGAYIARTNEILAANIIYGLCLVYPLAGWVADSLIGRYKAIVSGTILCLFASVLDLIGYSLMSGTYTYENVLAHISIFINCIGVSFFFANFIPFATDQLVGASSNDLSRLVHWYIWGEYASSLLIATVHFIIDHFTQVDNHSPTPRTKLTQNPLTYGIVFGVFAVILGSLILILVLDYCCSKRWLVTRSKLSNPIMLIIRVLNYARKNKYPRNRSAFTYIDEEQPSRLDLANTKFGGPFSEEEVEDVKTTLRLIPLIVLMPIFSLTQQAHINLPYHMLHTEDSLVFDLVTTNQFIFGLVGMVCIPAYNFMFLPLFHKCIPSMLKRVGIGMCVCLCAVLIYAIIDIAGHAVNKNATCLLNHTTVNEFLLPFNFHWSLVPVVIMAIGTLILSVASLMFTLAQSPAGMKGLLFGLWYAAMGLGELIGFNLPQVFSVIPPQSFPGCGFYFFLSIFALSSFTFVLFLIASRWYKLRMRERIVNIYSIVEEHYERYLDQEEEYLKAAGITPSYKADLKPNAAAMD